MAGAGLLQRVLHAPFDDVVFRQTVEDALQGRHISDEYSRLSHEVEVAERALVVYGGDPAPDAGELLFRAMLGEYDRWTGHVASEGEGVSLLERAEVRDERVDLLIVHASPPSAVRKLLQNDFVSHICFAKKLALLIGAARALRKS